MGETVFWPKIGPITTDFDGAMGGRFPPTPPTRRYGPQGRPGHKNIGWGGAHVCYSLPCKALALRPLLPRLNPNFDFLDLLRRPPSPGPNLRTDAAARALSNCFPGSVGSPCSPRRCCARLNYGQALLTRQTARQNLHHGKTIGLLHGNGTIAPAGPGPAGRRGRAGPGSARKCPKTEN